MAKIVLNTFGSLGDLHPYLALAIALKKRGHHPVIATSEIYRTKVAAEGISFAPVRPNAGELLDRPDFAAKLWDSKHGTEYLIRDYLIPRVAEGFDDLAAACRGADLLLTHAASYAGPIVGEALKLRWISIALQPAVFFSALDPSVVAPAPWLRHLYFLGPAFYRLLLRIADRKVRQWIGPILDLRTRLQLRPLQANPVMRGQFSPYGTIALFSRHLAAPQLDWPPQTRQTGFLFYDKLGEGLPGLGKTPPGLARFLDASKAPILFTLGSSAVMHAGTFYAKSLRAAELLGERAILLVGRKEQTALPTRLPESIFLADYVPYSEVMPRVAAIVHQGGIGTTAQSLRAGKPTLVVPWAHDQPDNAERLRKLGVARWLARQSFQARAAADQLSALLTKPRYAHRSATLGLEVAAETGEASACDAVEGFL